MTRIVCFGVGLALAMSSASAEPYWIAYEGNDFPENVGWERHQGVHSPPGDPNSTADRLIEDGVFVLDTTSDIWMYDYYQIHRQIDPAPGELFVAEWRVEVETQMVWWDASLVIARDDPPGDLEFFFGPDTLFVEETDETYEIGPGPHVYRFESWDMDEYRLYVDGAVIHEGMFQVPSGLRSFVAFGNGVSGASSSSRWDYVRFGVIPEPSTYLLHACLVITMIHRGVCKR